MKTYMLVLFAAFAFMYGCSNESSTNEKKYGHVLFYTNAQHVLNCGSFDVNLYINGEIKGVLGESFSPIGDAPDCTSVNSLSVLKLVLEEGVYGYQADYYCADSNSWNGEFVVSRDTCVAIFLDVTELENSESEVKKKLLGSWLELYPYDSSQTFIFAEDDSIYRIDNINNSKLSYYYQISNDSITVTRNWHIEESKKTTKHRLFFYSEDTLELKQFLATIVGFAGFKDITLIKIDEL